MITLREPQIKGLAGVLLLALLCAGCVTRDQTLFQEAEDLWLSDRYEEAVANLRVVAEQYPDSSLAGQALFRLGEIYYLNLDNPQKALDYFTRVTERTEGDELNLKAREYLGDIYAISLRNFDMSVFQYKRILKDHRGKVEEDKYQYKIADAYFHKGDFAQAEIEYQTFLERYKDSPLVLDAKYQVANCRFVVGMSAMALDLFTKILKDYPNSKYEYDVRLGIAISLDELGRLKDALKEYKKMFKKYPEKKILTKKISSIQQRLEKKLR